MNIPGPGRDDRPIAWRLWWALAFTPICRLINIVPVAEWRREAWSYRIDIWAMDHIGRLRFR